MNDYVTPKQRLGGPFKGADYDTRHFWFQRKPQNPRWISGPHRPPGSKGLLVMVIAYVLVIWLGLMWHWK